MALQLMRPHLSPVLICSRPRDERMRKSSLATSASTGSRFMHPLVRIVQGCCTAVILGGLTFPLATYLGAHSASGKVLAGPLSPREELATFRVPKGFRVELVACEPEVVDPVAMTFDEDGRIYVVEMHGYNGPKAPHERGVGEDQAFGGPRRRRLL